MFDSNSAPLICSDSSDAFELLCRAASASPVSPGDTIMFMPAGIQQIVPSQAGKPVVVNVLVDRFSADAVESQRAALEAQGKRPYFDFNHEDRQASFWPSRFFWSESPAPGIYAKGEYSAEGRAGVEGKSWRQFSPVFYVDDTKKNPARIVCRAHAKPNMGGLVNDPAFTSILPFWAKSAANPAGTATDGAHPSSTKTNTTNTISMTPEELAALQAKNKQLESELADLKAQEAALKAKNENNAVIAAQLQAKEHELKLGLQAVELESLKAKNADQEKAIKAHNAATAKAAVDAAIARGAIAAKDQTNIDAWIQRITDDPSMAALLAKVGGAIALDGRITPAGASAATAGNVQIVQMSGPATLKAIHALVAKQADVHSIEEKVKLSKEVAPLYAKFSGTPEFLDMPLSAADVSSADLGTLAGTLVAMRTIEDYEQQLIPSQFLTTDYSDVPGQFGQTTVTRVVVVPAVMGYDNTLGDDGRPKGYIVSTPAQTVDAPVTLNQHKAVEVVFSTEQLGSTVRNLFGEQENLQGYALALDVNGAVLGVITVGNFPGVAAANGNLGTEPEVVQLADFGRPAFANAAAGMNPLGVPIPGRYCLMNSVYFNRLTQDPTLVSLAVFQKPQIITGAELPPISKFQPLEASYLPNTGNLAAFFGHRSALVLQTRVPADYTQVLPGASFGNISVITGKTGVSFLRVQYVDHKGAYAASRLAIMYGTAKGNPKGGKIIKSA